MRRLILLMLFIFCFNVYSKECEKIFLEYEIDVKTKGYKGWQRVCNNDKLYLYTKKPLTKNSQQDVCKCFYYDYKNRDIDIKDR